MKCNYCNKEAKWVDNAKIYGRRYGRSYMVWWCKDCDAYVGCHNNTPEPLGTLANREVRELRRKAKNMFIEKMLNGKWNCDNKKKHTAYAKLGELMELKKDEMHFGMFQKEECELAIEIMTIHLKENTEHKCKCRDWMNGHVVGCKFNKN